MSNRNLIIIFLFQIIFSYNIFNHTQDYKISSSSYTASYSLENSIYNFFNPACNSDNNKFMYSVLGNNFKGILENQQILFSIKSKILSNINIALLRTSIDDIYDTSTAWNDHNQNGIVDANEIKSRIRTVRYRIVYEFPLNGFFKQFYIKLRFIF